MLRHHKPIYQHPGGNQEDRFQKKKKGLGMLPRPRFADRARFELAEGCPSTVFKTVSLGRSDTCPDARSHAQVFIIQKGGMLIFGSAVGLGFACWLLAISPSVISPSVSYADSSLTEGAKHDETRLPLRGSITSLPPM